MARRTASLTLFLALLFSLAGTIQAGPAGLPPAPPVPLYPDLAAPDPMIQLMIDQVLTDTLSTYDRQLAGDVPIWIDGAWYTIPTRYTYSGVPIDKTTRWAGEHLAGLGLGVEYHAWDDTTNPNVIGTITGTLSPDEIYIICAHIDAVSTTPGADDDASGSSGVLVAADIMSQYQWGCTLRFALWTGEEQWMLGSDAYADRAAMRGENIVGVLNLDMIAWNSPGSPPGIELHSTPDLPQSFELATFFSDVVGIYNIPLLPVVLDDGEASDQLPFWENGYNAILAIEDTVNDFNPYYHEPGDSPANMDWDYMTNYVKASLGTFAHMAGCLIPAGVGHLDGHVTAHTGGGPVESARVIALAQDGHAYPASTDPAGYYTRTLLPGAYTVTASAYGYLPATVVGVTVQTDTVTTQDFTLTRAATHTVSGTITEVGTGAPLYAEVVFQGSPVTVWSDPATGSYQAVLAEGSYTMLVRAESHRPQSRAIVVDHNQVEDFQLEPLPCLLLVDDDQNNPDVRPYYTSALDLLGLDYDVWDTSTGSSPAQEELSGYRQVLWFTGYPYNNTFTGANEAAVGAYLDEGGSFFLSSQDYLYEMHLSPFAQQYLHIAGYQNDVSQTTVAGANLYAGLGPYALSYPFSNYSDRVSPDLAGMVAFTGNAGNAAVAYEGAFHTVFFGFPLEAISALADRADVLESTLAFLGGCDCEPVEEVAFSWVPVTPTAGQLVTFQGVASGTSPIGYSWDMGDGTLDSGIVVAHTYTDAGDYRVTLTATNSCSSHSVAYTLTVAPRPCDAPAGLDFTWAPPTLTAGLPATFTAALVTGTAPLTYTWGWGDGAPSILVVGVEAAARAGVGWAGRLSDASGGAPSSGPTATHVFAGAGVYTVTLHVENECGEDETAHLVEVVEACAPAGEVEFSWQPLTPTAGMEVTLSAGATGSAPIVYRWDLGDGTLGNGITFTHVYTAAGTYTVALTATNGCGTAAIVHAVPVVAPVFRVYLPVILFSAEPMVALPPAPSTAVSK